MDTVSSRCRFQSTPSAWRETPVPFGASSIIFNFNPLPPHGGRRCRTAFPFRRRYFNPLPPHGGRLPQHRAASSARHFNPLPPHGGRRAVSSDCADEWEFQSTPSAWRETYTDEMSQSSRAEFQSTPSAWRETSVSRCSPSSSCISIHSLRMEGDLRLLRTPCVRKHFNPLPPHGGRHLPPRRSQRGNYFNPLPPHGGRLCYVAERETIAVDFNPLPPHGGRLSAFW